MSVVFDFKKEEFPSDDEENEFVFNPGTLKLVADDVNGVFACKVPRLGFDALAHVTVTKLSCFVAAVDDTAPLVNKFASKLRWDCNNDPAEDWGWARAPFPCFV